MLRVTVEIVPHGDESRAETLTEIFIGNDGTGTHEAGNYDIYTADPRGKPLPRNKRDGWIGRIEGFPREEGHRDLLSLKAFELLAGGD